MTIHYRQQGQVLIVFGQTFAHRERIKELGGRFNGGEKTWQLPLAALASISALCEGAGGGPLGGAAQGGPSPYLEALRADSALAGRVPEAADLHQGLTIRQLMDKVAGAVQTAFPAAVWVTGEVQNLARRGSSFYLDLAEARDGAHANATMTVRAVLWSSALQQIKARRGEGALAEVLQDGMQVRCLCQVQVYKDRGTISLNIEDVDPSFTKGALALAREKLLKELRAKGLDGAQKRLPLPPLPFRVGLITADGSRAKSDFLDQLSELRFPGEVVFCHAAMQGEGVPVQVGRALTALAAAGADLIVLTRGGGSAADLRWFDAPEVAYAIAGCAVPVVAAIGHHDDVSVAEEICFLRQKTPTAAADFVVSCFLRTRERIEVLAGGMARTLGRCVEEFALRTATLGERLAAAGARSLETRRTVLLARTHELLRGAERTLVAQGAALLARGHDLQRGAERVLVARGVALETAAGALARLDPRPWLAAGWTQLTGEAGLIRTVSDAPVGSRLKARLADGWLGLTVAQSTKRQEDTP